MDGRKRAGTVREVAARLVMPEKPLRIKLLGDSVTHGCGGTGFAEDGDLILRDKDYGERRRTHGYCWANLFARYMRDVCGCEVVNNAILGTSLDYALEHFDELVDPDDDVILSFYGANDRAEFVTKSRPPRTREQHMAMFMEKLGAFCARLDGTNADYIIISEPPDSIAGERGPTDGSYIRHFHMWDLNNMLMKGSVELKYPFIPLYNLYVQYCSARGADMRDLREWTEPTGCIHPNDAGSRVIFELLLMGLGLSPIPLV